MTTYVLDTSAVLAYFWQEPGWERVAEILVGNDHMISTVNLAELVGKACDAGMPPDEVDEMVAALKLNPQPFDAAQAFAAGMLRRATRHIGLSLGDRACLALAQSLGSMALTADRPWTQLEPALGIRVECIRLAEG